MKNEFENVIGLSDFSETIQKSFAEFEILEKAKYTKRTGSKGNYKYFYGEEDSKDVKQNTKNVLKILNKKYPSPPAIDNFRAANTEYLNGTDGKVWFCKEGSRIVEKFYGTHSVQNSIKKKKADLKNQLGMKTRPAKSTAPEEDELDNILAVPARRGAHYRD
jgi:hypothetical protein